MISSKICELLNRYQYFTPTPVQAKAIPLLMFGTDMLVQAKAGTGKTLVFGILAAKTLHEAEKTRSPLVLIVAPTREIAKQIYDTVRLFAPANFWSGLFVGGTDLNQDIDLLKKGCQLAVGTCGRIAQLIKFKVLHLKEVQLFVLDEADKLMEEDFVKQVNYIFSMMPHKMKQTCVFSATYPKQLETALKDYMNQPVLLRLNVESEQLVGVKEYCVFCDTLKKAEALMIVLSKLVFNQCIIFCESLEFCGDVYNYLVERGVECTSLGSNLPQTERFQILKKLKNQQIRVLVATDLMARGVDIFGVDLVVNLAPSFDMETHMHRVGRAGRFGGRGIAITMLGNTKEAAKFRNLMKNKTLDIRTLDVCENFPYNLIENGEEFYSKAVPFEVSFKMDDSNGAPPTSSKQADVPSRARTRKIFYTQREIAQIFASRTSKQWVQYSCENLCVLDYVCITGVMYMHPELSKFKKAFQQKQKSVEPVTEENPKSVKPVVKEEPKSVEPVVKKAKVPTPPPQIETKLTEEEIVDTLDSLELSDKTPESSQQPAVQNVQSKSDAIDEDELLKPFRAFRSVNQFRKIYDDLNTEFEKNKSDDQEQSMPLVPESLTAQQCRIDIEQMIELRKSALSKPN
ncbi:hypothetical protein M3Y97_00681900 [Aphelenchoides bicaudatus]|nr:hypothetical protein M3Y97_00681900 [Aphelenchoides bicaudatus]